MNEQILSVQRIQDYIEVHIDEEITMTELSKTRPLTTSVTVTAKRLCKPVLARLR